MLSTNKKYKIAIDFDGTLAEHIFPEIGKPVPHAFEVIKELKDADHEIYLWTMRSDGQKYGDVLSDAVNWCKHHGIEFDAVNSNPEQLSWTSSPKLHANIFIDDAALGCPLKENPRMGGRPYVDWIKVRELLVSMGVLV